MNRSVPPLCTCPAHCCPAGAGLCSLSGACVPSGGGPQPLGAGPGFQLGILWELQRTTYSIPICLFFNIVFFSSSVLSQKAGNEILKLNRDPRSRLLGQAPVAEHGADLHDTCQLSRSLWTCSWSPFRTSVPRNASRERAAVLSRAEQAGSPGPPGVAPPPALSGAAVCPEWSADQCLSQWDFHLFTGK